jgi:hypothetical protein
MPNLGNNARHLRRRPRRRVDARRPQLCSQQMPPAKHVQRQIAVTVVIVCRTRCFSAVFSAGGLVGVQMTSLSTRVLQNRPSRDDHTRTIQKTFIHVARHEKGYAKGTPECQPSTVYLGNSLTVLPRLAAQVARGAIPRAKLLFTSPPYCGITNYHYDQWLRLWLLGGPPHAGRNGNGRCGKFDHRDNYTILLDQVFRRPSVFCIETPPSTFARTRGGSRAIRLSAFCATCFRERRFRCDAAPSTVPHRRSSSATSAKM